MAALTLLRAPAGYGKSALLHQWRETLGASATIITLGMEDSGGFDVEGVLSRPYKDLRIHIESILKGRTPPPGRTLPEIITGLPSSDRPLAVVVDSLEQYQPDGIRWLSSHLQDGYPQLSQPIHIVLSGRTRAGLMTGAAASQGLVTNISHADLAFTLAELEQLLGDADSPPTSNLEGLLLDTRGWPAGVRMYQGFSSTAAGVGLGPVIDSYVETEILEKLEPTLRNLVLNFPLPPYLTTELIEAICPEGVEAQDAIVQIGQVLPVMWHRTPNGTPSYRLLPIVSSSLRRIAQRSPDPDAVSTMVRKATAWFIAHHQLADSVHLGSTSGEWTIVLNELRDPCRRLAERDQHGELLDILESIPIEQLRTVPELSFWRLLALLSTGRHREAFRDWDLMMEYRPMQPDSLCEGRQLLYWSLRGQAEGHPEAALESATKALQILPPTAHHDRFRALSVVRDCSENTSATILREIEADLRFARSLLPLEQQWWWTHCVPAQIDQRALAGNLDAAFDVCQHQVRTMPQFPEAARLTLQARLAEIDLERGDAGTALSHLHGTSDGMIRWREGMSIDLVRARVLHDLGQDTAARNLVYTCIRTAEAMGDVATSGRARATLAQFWLDRGDIELAQVWADEEQPGVSGWITSFGEPLPALVLAELLIAKQQADEAQALLERVASEANRRGHTALLVRCHALMAQACWSMGDQQGLHTAIAEAIRLGSRHRFRRSYMVGTMDIRTLSSRPAPLVVSPFSRSSEAPEMVLTDRELEILQLVASGLKNPDISERLYISPFTVKNHLANIFTKLNVRNRADAIRMAQSMGWL